jgi:hypothetical protein
MKLKKKKERKKKIRPLAKMGWPGHPILAKEVAGATPDFLLSFFFFFLKKYFPFYFYFYFLKNK